MLLKYQRDRKNIESKYKKNVNNLFTVLFTRIKSNKIKMQINKSVLFFFSSKIVVILPH
jgi:hypothetical protein